MKLALGGVALRMTLAIFRRMAYAHSARIAASRRAASTLTLASWERAAKRPALLNLAIGQPAKELLPMAELERAEEMLIDSCEAEVLV